MVRLRRGLWLCCTRLDVVRVILCSNPLLLVDALHLVEDSAGEFVRRGLATHVAGADLTLGLLVIVLMRFEK